MRCLCFGGRGEGPEKCWVYMTVDLLSSKVGCCINKVVAGQLSDNVTASGNYKADIADNLIHFITINNIIN